MRILLDHCVDWRLSRSLVGHDVRTTQQMGWEQLSNGSLLAAAAKDFDVLVTVDQSIKNQQNPSTLPIAVVVLIAPTNRLAELVPLVPAIERALTDLPPRTLVEVTSSSA